MGEVRSLTVSPRTSPTTTACAYETWPLPDPAEWDIDGIRPPRDYVYDANAEGAVPYRDGASVSLSVIAGPESDLSW